MFGGAFKENQALGGRGLGGGKNSRDGQNLEGDPKKVFACGGRANHSVPVHNSISMPIFFYIINSFVL